MTHPTPANRHDLFRPAPSGASRDRTPSGRGCSKGYVAWLSSSGAALSYHTAIVTDTLTNTAFRRVLFTGANSQWVVMALPPGEATGEETHAHVEQTLFFVRGAARVVLNGQEIPLGPGDAVVVSPGTRHNGINTGAEPLQLYTVYAPPIIWRGGFIRRRPTPRRIPRMKLSATGRPNE